MQLLKTVRIGDILLITFVALSALALWLFPLSHQTDAAMLEIEVIETGAVHTYPLTVDADYSVTSGDVHLTVTVRDGETSVSASDCENLICLHSPAISRAGQSIVCAPAGIVIRIVGEEVDADAISG